MEFYWQIVFWCISFERETAILSATAHLIGRIGIEGMLVYIEGAAFGHGRRVEFLSVTEEVEGFGCLVVTQGTPTDNHLAPIADGDDTTVQLLMFQFAEVIVRLGVDTKCQAK